MTDDHKGLVEQRLESKGPGDLDEEITNTSCSDFDILLSAHTRGSLSGIETQNKFNTMGTLWTDSSATVKQASVERT